MLGLERLEIRQGAFRLFADLTVQTGEIVAVLGPSGAGKSTLLSVIGGFLDPAGGRVTWQGQDLTGRAPGDRPVTTIFQDNNLFPHLTAWQNVALGMRPSLRLSAAEGARVEASLARVGLDGLGGRRPAQLSGGQQSRVALARMAVAGRPLVLLDEPFGALGPALRAEMLDLVAELARDDGLTVVFVTHDPEDARRIAGRTILVADGVAQPPVATAALLDAPPQALRDYLGT